VSLSQFYESHRSGNSENDRLFSGRLFNRLFRRGIRSAVLTGSKKPERIASNKNNSRIAHLFDKLPVKFLVVSLKISASPVQLQIFSGRFCDRYPARQGKAFKFQIAAVAQ
jgi:hypothetical protein